MDVQAKREKNEKKYGTWEVKDYGRRYWCEIQGRSGWKARYVKDVDREEKTIRFFQEIFDSTGKLVERHQKYPVDTGHEQLGV